MITPSKVIPEITDADAGAAFDLAAGLEKPTVFRGLVRDWPLVAAGNRSAEAASRYLLDFYQGAPVTAFVSEVDIGGRLAYNEALSETNFRQVKTDLPWVLEQLQANGAAPGDKTVYMGSSAINVCLPGLQDRNSLPAGDRQASTRIWLGNRTTVAAHFDVLENIACVAAGRRRFTLIPPDQLPNLYVGPMEITPAGQQISLVDLRHPDLEAFPRAAEALAQAQVAELGPGDAIFIPSMWWHHVEGLDAFNVLINHWWRDVPSYMGPPGDALLHAMMSIRDLPRAQRDAWRVFFEHYVFGATPESVEHIPVASRGALGAMDDATARRIRTLLRNKLNR